MALVEKAEVANLPGVRYWGDTAPRDLAQMAQTALHQAKAHREKTEPGGRNPGRLALNFLALSGGGSNGAFGAGLLVGWSEHGNRPNFNIVSGVSTGALIAPFAFLGPSYDSRLTEIFTKYETSDLLRKRPVLGLLGGQAVTDNRPFARLIAKYVDRDMLAAITREHNKGRRLFIATTNLDAQRPVVWNMGRIAASDHPDALALFRKILLASASIPGVFPPVYIDVNAGGHHAKEMHVDGGTTDVVFLVPIQVSFSEIDKILRIRSNRTLFVIWNGRISPEWKPVESNTFKIAARSIATVIKSHGIADLQKLYTAARRDGTGYKLAAIPGSFPDTSKESFDKVYMNKLYRLGYRLGRTDYHWMKAPPGFKITASR
jgi:predicted acylesterase/phospholipase RssA